MGMPVWGDIGGWGQGDLGHAYVGAFADHFYLLRAVAGIGHYFPNPIFLIWVCSNYATRALASNCNAPQISKMSLLPQGRGLDDADFDLHAIDMGDTDGFTWLNHLTIGDALFAAAVETTHTHRPK